MLSMLPIVTCSGRGEFAEFCYSLKAWQFPSAFLRQLQNTILIRRNKDVIEREFNNLASGIDLRLYVDGDFDSLETLSFWFSLLESRKDINAYGYSKSWNILLKYKGGFPENYTLNISNGSRYSDDVKEQVKKLPIVRGDFIALEGIRNRAITKDDDDWNKHVKYLREKAKEILGLDKVFVCPGKCGSCTGSGHLCGMSNVNIPVVIGKH